MSLTPEQFNLLVTKEYLKDFYTKGKMDDKFDRVFTTLDAVIIKLDNIEHAFVSNLAAPDRFEERISRLENYIGLNQPKIKIANN